jgi:hypothetical protein
MFDHCSDRCETGTGKISEFPNHAGGGAAACSSEFRDCFFDDIDSDFLKTVKVGFRRAGAGLLHSSGNLCSCNQKMSY